jgi:hypothetical protein
MKELVLNMFEDMVEFRESFIIAGEVIKEKLEEFYVKLSDKALEDGIKGKFWDAVFYITAVLNLIVCVPFIPVAFVLIDLPYDILGLIILLNHWDFDD